VTVVADPVGQCAMTTAEDTVQRQTAALGNPVIELDHFQNHEKNAVGVPKPLGIAHRSHYSWLCLLPRDWIVQGFSVNSASR
jgi:hypothetical protein